MSRILKIIGFAVLAAAVVAGAVVIMKNLLPSKKEVYNEEII